jgi:four helix bundle protein
MELALTVYRLTQEFPREEIYGLTSQMRRSVVSIPSKIAEGQGRGNVREFAHFLEIARGSLCELQTQLELSRSLAFGEPELFDKCENFSHEVGKMIFVLIRKFKTTSS